MRREQAKLYLVATFSKRLLLIRSRQPFLLLLPFPFPAATTRIVQRRRRRRRRRRSNDGFARGKQKRTWIVSLWLGAMVAIRSAHHKRGIHEHRILPCYPHDALLHCCSHLLTSIFFFFIHHFFSSHHEKFMLQVTNKQPVWRRTQIHRSLGQWILSLSLSLSLWISSLKLLFSTFFFVSCTADV
jgi:hypothetical protein